MTRDKRKDEDHFSLIIKSCQEKSNEEKKFMIENNCNTPISYFMLSDLLRGEFVARYSRGDSIRDLKRLYAEILDSYIASISDSDIYNISLEVISLGILFEVDKSKLRQLYDLIKQYKQDDKIFSLFLHPVLQTMDIYPKLRFKKSKSTLMLEKILSSNKEDAQILIKDYLENYWYSKENLDEVYNSHKKGGYAGYWSWEAAAIVKVMNLDDSSFKDNEYYPSDLVHCL